MATYKVSANETNYFSFYVEADSEEEALKKGLSIIEKDGIPSDAKVFNREFDIPFIKKTLGLKYDV